MYHAVSSLSQRLAVSVRAQRADGKCGLAVMSSVVVVPSPLAVWLEVQFLSEPTTLALARHLNRLHSQSGPSVIRDVFVFPPMSQSIGFLETLPAALEVITDPDFGCQHGSPLVDIVKNLTASDFDCFGLPRVRRTLLAEALAVAKRRVLEEHDTDSISAQGATAVAPPAAAVAAPPPPTVSVSPSSSSLSSSSTLPTVPITALDRRKLLGRGSFGEVYQAWWVGGHCLVAVKANGVRCADTTAIENERRLLEVLLHHPHDNILPVFAICLDAPDGGVRLVLKYCAGAVLQFCLHWLHNAHWAPSLPVSVQVVVWKDT